MEYNFILNRDITIDTIKRIIDLKKEHWPYDYNSQISWIKQNLQDEDIHYFLCEGERLIAYLNTVFLDVESDHHKFKMLGIGNVCVDKQYEHTGIGRKLITSINSYLDQIKESGILLCKLQITGFYEKCNWHKLPSKTVFINQKKYENDVMVYSSNDLINSAFKNTEKIVISRNF